MTPVDHNINDGRNKSSKYIRIMIKMEDNSCLTIVVLGMNILGQGQSINQIYS